MKQKFATIDIETESNVGVLNLGHFNDIHEDHLNDHINKNVAETLLVALEEHFCCTVKIKSSKLMSLHPITIEFNVVVESDGENHSEVVTLNETWLYLSSDNFSSILI